MNKLSYTTIQDWMLDLGLDIYETFAYAVIFGFSQDGESTFKGSLSYLSRKVMCSRSKVIRVLKSLADKNLIQKIEETRNGVKFCEYRAIAPCTGGVCETPGGGVCGTPKNKDIENKETNIDNVCKEDSLFGGGSLEEPIGKSDNHPQKEGANSLLASVEDKRKKREVLFRNECMGFAGEFGREMVERFIEYWTEPTKNRAKMRFELERTWDTHRRMLTWSRKSYNQPSVQAEPQRKPMSVDEALRRAYGKH